MILSMKWIIAIMALIILILTISIIIKTYKTSDKFENAEKIAITTTNALESTQARTEHLVTQMEPIFIWIKNKFM